jgi:diguanylate cyclase (GGDEF)-like protein/PAS domain S-box-containing protein
MQMFGDSLDVLRGAGDLDDLVDRTAQCVKHLTGFDRVMVYRFDDDWNGHVIADVHEPEMESFFDLHYPASDIPAQARELYRTNLVRFIPDVDAAPVPVLPWLDNVRMQPLDMSHAMLRSASPIHLQYLRNMGVRSTLTISLLVDGRLWGLIACHHRTPTTLPIRLRRACYALAINVGFMTAWNEQRLRAAATTAMMQTQSQIVDAFNHVQMQMSDVIEQCGAALLRIAGATGGALWRGDSVFTFGRWPGGGARSESVLRYVRNSFETSTEDFLHVEQVPLDPPADVIDLRTVCGLMAIQLDAFAFSGLVWIRPEFRREVVWGGDPEKPMEMEIDASGQPKLSPRTSFARWETVVKGRCRPWSEMDRAGARSLLTLRQVLSVRDSLGQVSLSDRQFRSLVALQSDAYWQVDLGGRLVTLSKRLPMEHGPVEGRSLADVFSPYCQDHDIAAMNLALSSKKPFRGLHLRGHAEGQQGSFEVLINGEPIRAQDGRTVGWHGTITDVTRQLALQEALRQRDVEQQAMLDNELIGIVKLRERRLVWKNKAMDRIFGYGPDELYGKSSRILYPDDAAFQALDAAASGALQAGQSYRTQVQMVRRDGKPLWIDLSGVLLSVEGQESMWLLADITPQEPALDHVEQIALHDVLTGLPNRLLLADRLSQALATARRHDGWLAVCYLDLDGFRQVDAHHGPMVADRVIREMARRLQESLRVTDTVFRMGGDEFILLLTQLEQAAQVEAVLKRVTSDIAEPVMLDAGRSAHLSATIGVAVYPADGDAPDVLLGNAERAMHRGKQLGGNQICMHQAASPSA